MKNILFFVFFLFHFGMVSAQMDTIYTHHEIIPCRVTEVTENHVKFAYPQEDFSNTMSKNKIMQIVFRSGRVQKFVNALGYKRLRSPHDWEQVVLTQVENELAGLYKIGDVSSKAKGTTELSNQERVKRRGLNKLKMQAALLGANVIYMLNMRTEGNHYDARTGSSFSSEASFIGMAYASTVPVYEQFMQLIGDQRVFRITEAMEFSYNSTKIDVYPVDFSIHIKQIVDDEGRLKIYAQIPQFKEGSFRVTFLGNDHFYILYATRNEYYSYRVLAR